MTPSLRRPLLLAAVSALLSAGLVLGGVGARAQDLSSALMMAEPGEEAEPDELEAWRLVQDGRNIKAREVAEEIVAERPDSYVGHFVLGFVYHYAEASFPRALYHENLALGLFEGVHGPAPVAPAPWRWHARILRELALTHGDLEHHAEKVAYLERYNELYDPDLIAEQAWPLMKMGRYEAARAAAERGLAEGSPRELEVALNALCAIEFEAGNDGASYEACRVALEYGRTQPGGPNAVDLTNFAEASRSMFKLDEAERIGLEAARADMAWYGNPWVELAELYTRQGRFPEALHALEQVPPYRARRPPHVQDADRNEARRALSAFFVVVGRPEDALRITEKALIAPDRRAHNSRDPNQDLAIAALLDRRARLIQAEMSMERAAARPFWDAPASFWEATRLRVEAWMSARRAARLLADDDRLVGIFRIGTSASAIIPPWLAGELAEVLGPGVVTEAVRRARVMDERPGAGAYYDAFEAEAALVGGDPERSLELAERARRSLGSAEVLLGARVEAIAAEASRRSGRSSSAWEAAFLADPGVFRRLGISVPVRVEGAGGAVGEGVLDSLSYSPRFDVGDTGLRVSIEADAAGGRVCLLGHSGGILGCGEAVPDGTRDPDALATALVDDLHRAAFAPRIDLSQADANSLDGSNRESRDPLQDLLPSPSALDDEPPVE